MRLGVTWLLAILVGVTAPLFAKPLSAGDSRPGEGAPDIVPVVLPTIVPTRMYLKPDAEGAPLRLTNERPVTVRFTLATYAWGMKTDGGLILQPTDTLKLSAGELWLKPGETAEIWVEATAAPVGDDEESYRIGISEQPEEAEADHDVPSRTAELSTAAPPGGRIRALAAITLPVFRPPADARPDGRLDARPLDDGAFVFSIANHGRAHLFAREVAVRGEDETGATVFATERNGWYVLAGDRREYRVSLTAEHCRRSHRLVLTARLLDGATLERPVVLDQRPCGVGGGVTGFAASTGTL